MLLPRVPIRRCVWLALCVFGPAVAAEPTIRVEEAQAAWAKINAQDYSYVTAHQAVNSGAFEWLRRVKVRNGACVEASFKDDPKVDWKPISCAGMRLDELLASLQRDTERWPDHVVAFFDSSIGYPIAVSMRDHNGHLSSYGVVELRIAGREPVFPGGKPGKPTRAP